MRNWYRGLSETTQGLVFAVALGLVVIGILMLIRRLA
jgi:hypothetical protein